MLPGMAKTNHCFHYSFGGHIPNIPLCWMSSFEIGSSFVKSFFIHNKISTIYVIYFLVKSLFSENSTKIRPLELEATENILILLNRPFKSTENNQYLIWEEVMILRRLVLVVVTTFVLKRFIQLDCYWLFI